MPARAAVRPERYDYAKAGVIAGLAQRQTVLQHDAPSGLRRNLPQVAGGMQIAILGANTIVLCPGVQFDRGPEQRSGVGTYAH